MVMVLKQLQLSIAELLLLLSLSFCQLFLPSFCQSVGHAPCDWKLPRPFGYSGANEGFNVKCDKNNSVKLDRYSFRSRYDLQIGNVDYQLRSISILDGLAYIDTGALYILCPNSSRRGSGWIDLRGTPYAFTAQNKLTAVGCNTAALITIPLRLGNNVTIGCKPFCGTNLTATDGGCSCCQAYLPTGVKSFDFKLSTLNSDGYASQCSQAFLAMEGSLNMEKILQSKSGNERYNEVVLEWTIGSETCGEAMEKSEYYACQDNSYCYDPDPFNLVGYRCNCSIGYRGNPYEKGGCKDIDECADPSLNPCVEICINTPGNVSCACPRGKRGDGLKQGKGCEKERLFPLETVLGVGIGSAFMLIFGSLYSFWFFKKRELVKLKTKFFRQNGGLLLQQQISTQGNATMKIFSMEELRKATGNFDERHILGRGGYGTVYKGVLPDHRVVAIKKSKLMDESQIEQFINEVVILSQINHRNVVKLLGCCLETQVPLLVYEFISKGSLFERIHSKENLLSLSWDDRLRIATETAGALAYLHSAASIPIIHRDVKSSNILLDQSYTAKVSDFGASRSVPFDQTHVTTLVQGTFGYLDPEYFQSSQLTEKSDVYSFGVVLVELMTGEMPVSFARSENLRNLASYFIILFNENRIFEMMEAEILAEAGIEQISSVAHLVRRCLSLKGYDRPTMKEVAMELEGLRRSRQQHMVDQPRSEEVENLLGGIETSNLCHEVDTSRQFSLENEMIMSADFPR